MLFGHGERHEQHGGEVGGIRHQVEIKEKSVCEWSARLVKQEYRPHHIAVDSITAVASALPPQSNSRATDGGKVWM